MNRIVCVGIVLLACAGCPGGDSGKGQPKQPASPVAMPDPGSGLPTALISKSQLKANMMAIKTGADRYKVENGKFPKDVAALIKAEWLREKESKDPWGRPYLIETKGRKVVVVTYGADGKPGGSDADTDYTSLDVLK